MSAPESPESKVHEPQPGVMHPVDRAFYDLAVKERNYERVKVDRLQAERDRYREALVWIFTSAKDEAVVVAAREALDES